MKIINIKIKVPNWIPTLQTLRQYKRKVRMWMFPPRCLDCNKRLNTYSFYWKQNRTGTHPLGIKDIRTNFAMRVNRSSCNSCIKTFIQQCPKDIGNCAICETQNVPVMGYTFNKETKTIFTFLWAWWNGSTFCMKCIDELLEKGEPTTDVYEIVIKNNERTLVPRFY